MSLSSIVETRAFAREASSLLEEDEIEDLKVFLAKNPKAGVVIPRSSGVRKLRWSVEGRGKRGGARVIYYYHNTEVPLFLLSMFAKNEKADLTSEDLKAVRQFAETIAKEHQQRKD